MRRHRFGHLLVLPTALAVGLAACSSINERADSGTEAAGALSGTISGTGASSQDAAQQAWQAGFIAQHPDVTVDYDPIGSGGGREQFVNGGSDFGSTDAYLNSDELAAAQQRCEQVVEIPTYISPIVLVFNLDGIDELNLGPTTIAKIFNQQVTTWNDPAITEDNPHVELPHTPITPVHRSDRSGTTENLTDYLKTTASQAWPHEVSDDWPVTGGEAAQGTSGVAQAVAGGNGTIGYVDASQVGDLSTVKIKVGDEFIAYSPEAAAKVLEVSERMADRGDYSFAYELARDTTESGAYPIVLVSYAIACTHYDDANKADLVRNYFNYMISAEGQQAAAEAAGSAPISDTLREQIQPAVDEIGSGS